MNQVLDWLYLGSLDDAENDEWLREAGIEALLSLAYPVKHPDILISYVPFDDGEPIPEEVLYKALSFVRRKRREGRKILIACSAGVSSFPHHCYRRVARTGGLSAGGGLSHSDSSGPQRVPTSDPLGLALPLLRAER